MGRDRKGAWKLCEIMELRNRYVEPKAEFSDEEEKNEDDPFAKFSEPSKRANTMPPPGEKEEEFAAWLHWWVSPQHPILNGEHPYEYYVTYIGLNRN